LANLPKNSPAGTYPLVVSNNAGGGVVSTPFSLTIQNGNGNGGGTSTSSTTNLVILRVVPDYVQNKLSIVGTNFQGQTGTDVPSVTLAGILWPPASTTQNTLDVPVNLTSYPPGIFLLVVTNTSSSAANEVQGGA